MMKHSGDWQGVGGSMDEAEGEWGRGCLDSFFKGHNS